MQVPILLSLSMHLFLAPPNLNTSEFLYLCAVILCERAFRRVLPAIAVVHIFLRNLLLSLFLSETAAAAFMNLKNVGATVLHSKSTFSHLKTWRSDGVVFWRTDPKLWLVRYLHSFWTISTTAVTATSCIPGTLMTTFGMRLYLPLTRWLATVTHFPGMVVVLEDCCVRTVIC